MSQLSSARACAVSAIAWVVLLLIAPAANAQATDHGTRLLRTPTVSATQIAFAYANNIWTVARSGGSARRVTSFQGQTLNPHFSPDGKWIAFSGEYAGNLDVYVVPADGGVKYNGQLAQVSGCTHHAVATTRPTAHLP